MSALLEVRIERASYGNVAVLRDLELDVAHGEVVALLGANGAGKTTLLRSISGLLVSVQGEIRFDGEDLRGISAHKRVGRGLAHVPEGRHVFSDLSVLENLRIGAHPVRSDKASFTSRLERALDLFPRLAERREQRAASLSGGEQQMLAIARGLMSGPQLLMVDEASLGLAPVAVELVFDSLAAIAREGSTSVLLVEQNAKASLAIAHRAYVLERGRVAMSGDADELSRDPRITAVYLGGEVSASHATD